jgi:hypothetical protein
MIDAGVVTGSRDGKLSWWAEPVELTCKQWLQIGIWNLSAESDTYI